MQMKRIRIDAEIFQTDNMYVVLDRESAVVYYKADDPIFLLSEDEKEIIPESVEEVEKHYDDGLYAVMHSEDYREMLEFEILKKVASKNLNKALRELS